MPRSFPYEPHYRQFVNIGVCPRIHHERSTGCDILLLRNYGVIVAGTLLREVIDRMISFEFMCKLWAFSRERDIKLSSLPGETISSFNEYVRKNKLTMAI